MYEISFSDGPYREPYKEENTQVYLNGVSYESGGLVLKFRDNHGNIYDKKTHNVLEMLISSEVLFGSELWKFKASLSQFYSSYNGTRKYVSSKAIPDESFINSYKESSVAFKVFLSDQFSKIPNYGGYSSYPDLKNTSYPSYCQPIDQPANFKVELFEYQKKSISKMLSIEKKEIELEADYNHIFDFGEVSINFNPNISNNEDNSKESKLRIKCNGGILSDEMGLGKTITSLALVALNPSTYTEQYKENLIYSNGTLIVCPSHLSKQWETEVKKIFPKANIIRLLTKNNHVSLTYKDIKDADIIIVTQQFLMNFKYYPQVHYQYCTPSNFVFSNRITNLKNVLQGWRDDNTDIMKEKQPNLEHFFFHRLIVDEGHEIFGLQLTNSSMARYMSDWLSQVNSNFKWFVSGTPFVNYDGLKKCLKFIDIKIEDKDSGQDISSQDYINKKYIIDNILSNIMIRHRKVDVENQIQIPGYEEEVIWVKHTELERNLYNSKRNSSVSDLTLQQLCCHILVSDTSSKIFGTNTEIDLDSMQDKLIEYHRGTVEVYEKKLIDLNPDNQAYAMLKKNYQTKVSESKYMLGILEKMSKKEELEIEKNCSICFDDMCNPSLTPCGHMFCKNCLDMCLGFKKECPMCKADLNGKEIYLVESKEKKEEDDDEINPLIKKYGSKLGKLISVVRKLITNDNNRIIIFSQWDRMLNLIGKSLGDNGVANSFVKGNVWSRNSAISKFKLGKNNNGEDSKVIMLSLSNSASGTNLTEATHIIFVEPINSRYDEMKAIEGQAIGRACRLGQANKVKVMRILTKDTIEEQIYENIYSKNLDNIKRTIMIDDGNLENDIIV